MSAENIVLIRKQNIINRVFQNWSNIIHEGKKQEKFNDWMDTTEIKECTERLNTAYLDYENFLLDNLDKNIFGGESTEFSAIRDEWESLVSNRINSWPKLRELYGDCSFVFQDRKGKFLFGLETPKSRQEKDRKVSIEDFENRYPAIFKKPLWKRLFRL